MNRNFKMAMYFLITILVIGAVATLMITILPYVIITGLIIWAIFKIRKYINQRKNKYNSYEETTTYTSSDDNLHNEGNVDEEYDTSKAIDVDYEDVDKK